MRARRAINHQTEEETPAQEGWAGSGRGFPASLKEAGMNWPLLFPQPRSPHR